MISFITANLATIIVGTIVVALLGGAIYKMHKDKKQGNKCSGCSGCSQNTGQCK